MKGRTRLNDNTTSDEVTTLAMDIEVLVTRLVADMEDTSIIGSTTNLWLNGRPTDSTIKSYFAVAQGGRGLDVHVAPAAYFRLAATLKTLGEQVTVGKSTPGFNGNYVLFSYMRVGFHVYVYHTRQTVEELLVCPAADLTANMKYVHRDQLVGIIPMAVPDALAGHYVALNTLQYSRARVLANKRQRNRNLPVRGFYGTCVEPPPPPPPPTEKYAGVLSGWRSYTLLEGTDTRWPVLQGQFGGNWKYPRMHAECKAGGRKEDVSNAQHLFDCTCGIYMQWRPRTNRSEMWDVYASCVAWGKVALHSAGCRAEWVKFTKLYVVNDKVSDEDVHFLGKIYEVPVVKTSESLYRGDKAHARFLGVESMLDDRYL